MFLLAGLHPLLQCSSEEKQSIPGRPTLIPGTIKAKADLCFFKLVFKNKVGFVRKEKFLLH